MGVLQLLIELWLPISFAGLISGALLTAVVIRSARGWKRLAGILAGVSIAGASVLTIAVFSLYGPQVRGLALDVERFIGQPAPDLAFTLYPPGSAPEPGSLDDYRGRVVLLQFWGSWCSGSCAGMPNLSALAEAYPDDAVILSISDEPREQFERYLTQNSKLRQRIGLVSGDVPDPYTVKIRGRPMTFIIDREGILREHFFGSRPREGLAGRLDAYR